MTRFSYLIKWMAYPVCFRICIFFLCLIFLVSCGNDDSSDPMVSTNQAPIAIATSVAEEDVGFTVSLNGGASSDPDGDVITYLWEFVSVPGGSSATIINSTSSSAQFVPDVAGLYTVKLTVSDGELTDEDQVTITATLPELITTLIINTAGGGVSEASVGSEVIVTSSNFQSTSEGDTPVGPTGEPLIITFELSKPAGSAATLIAVGAGEAGQEKFTMDYVGSYEVKLTVDDGLQTATDIQTIVTTAPMFVTFLPIFGRELDSITVSGQNFSAITLQNQVEINGVSATVISTTGYPEPVLTVQIPSGVSTGTISVTLGTDEAISTDKFYAYPDVTVSTFAGSTQGNADGTGINAQFDGPFGITYYANDDELYVVDQGNNTIRKITNAGAVSTWAGDGTAGFMNLPGTSAQFNDPQGIAIDNTGTFVRVSDSENNRIRTISISSASVSTFAGDGTKADLDGTGMAAQFADGLLGLVYDVGNNLFAASNSSHVIRKIDGAGVVTTFAGTSGAAGFTNDTGTSARFNGPAGMAIDGNDNIYLADLTNNRIRKITPAAVVTTLIGTGGNMNSDGVGAQTDGPGGLFMDTNNGILYLAEFNGHTIRQIILEANLVLTIAGLGSTSGDVDGTGLTARFNSPVDLTMDSNGILYVVDQGNHKIRKIIITLK